MSTEWNSINYNLLKDYGQKNYEISFVNILTEEIHKKLPNYKIISFFKLNSLPHFMQEERPENMMNRPLVEIRKELCEKYWDTLCRSEQCFDGKFNSTEIDGIIIRENDFCLLEYEESRKSLCNNFMKFYRLRRLLDKPFESLFVTRLSTKKEEGYTTFERFNKYIDNIKPILDKLLQNWMIVEIVDLHSVENRTFSFKP